MTMFNLDHRLKRGVASALAVAIVGGGAAGAIAAGTGGGSQAKPVTAAQPNSFTVRTSAAASVKRPTVRAGLKRAETAAEDVIAYLEQGRPAKSRAEAKLLKRLTHGKVAAELAQAGVPKVKIQALQQRAERVERLSSGGAPKLDVSLAANQVSQLMPSLYARYKDPVPPAVLRLDYLDREIQLRSMGGQTGQIQAAGGGGGQVLEQAPAAARDRRGRDGGAPVRRPPASAQARQQPGRPPEAGAHGPRHRRPDREGLPPEVAAVGDSGTRSRPGGPDRGPPAVRQKRRGRDSNAPHPE
jgi:hypothetical protein